jgi:hypothetical protein
MKRSFLLTAVLGLFFVTGSHRQQDVRMRHYPLKHAA